MNLSTNNENTQYLTLLYCCSDKKNQKVASNFPFNESNNICIAFSTCLNIPTSPSCG